MKPNYLWEPTPESHYVIIMRVWNLSIWYFDPYFFMIIRPSRINVAPFRLIKNGDIWHFWKLTDDMYLKVTIVMSQFINNIVIGAIVSFEPILRMLIGYGRQQVVPGFIPLPIIQGELTNMNSWCNTCNEKGMIS